MVHSFVASRSDGVAMHALEFLRNPSTPGVRPFYAVFGDEPFLRRESVDAILRVALDGDSDGMAAAHFDGEKANLASVLDEARTLPFLAPRRVVVVDNADPFVTKSRRELEAYAEAPSPTGTLVLAVKTWPSNTKLAKLVEKVGLAIECKTPGERELTAWLAKFAKGRHGATLAADAAELLIELVGAEVGLLAAEVEKLATFVGDRKEIGREDVARVVGAGRIETIWKVLDAATTGRSGDALDDLDRLLTSGEHPVGLLAAMTASLRKVHHAGQLRRSKVELREACKQAGIPTFPAAIESTRKQHAHLGPTRVDQLPERLLRADLDLKGSSRLPPRTILERLLVELSRPRQD